MAKQRPKPTFTPVDDKVWHVDVVWECGLKEEVPGFRSYAEAQDWIDHKSAAWLKAKGIKREKTKKGRR
jgi:G:T-mismatch repair DNA endonuclease (very short patch repair protein)